MTIMRIPRFVWLSYYHDGRRKTSISLIINGLWLLGVHFFGRCWTAMNCFRFNVLVAPQGFEPRYADPESAVLPLNEGAVGGMAHAAGTRLHIISAGNRAVNPTHLLTLLLQLLQRSVRRFEACFNYNRDDRRGTLLNCVWLVLDCRSSRACLWIMAPRDCRAEKLLPSRRLQFTALLLLVILLSGHFGHGRYRHVYGAPRC